MIRWLGCVSAFWFEHKQRSPTFLFGHGMLRAQQGKPDIRQGLYNLLDLFPLLFLQLWIRRRLLRLQEGEGERCQRWIGSDSGKNPTMRGGITVKPPQVSAKG
eukprot:5275680-Amphidinium_carterae.1